MLVSDVFLRSAVAFIVTGYNFSWLDQLLRSCSFHFFSKYVPWYQCTNVPIVPSYARLPGYINGILYGATRSILKDLLLVLWYLLSIIFHPHPYSKSKWVGEHESMLICHLINVQICHVLCASCIMLIYEHICLYAYMPNLDEDCFCWILFERRKFLPECTQEEIPRYCLKLNENIFFIRRKTLKSNLEIKWKHILYRNKNIQIQMKFSTFTRRCGAKKRKRDIKSAAKHGPPNQNLD